MTAYLARGDYSQIEARVNPWLAGAEWKLDAFRRFDMVTGYTPKGKPIRAGAGLYEVGAAGIYGVTPEDITPDDPRRQVGKVSELALGFQGGAAALQAMCKAYALAIPRFVYPDGYTFDDREANPAPVGTDQWIVEKWRKANPEIRLFWRDLETAAADCVGTAPGGEFFAGAQRIRFKRNKQAMTMHLPSGRCLFYWNPSLQRVRTAWGAWKWAVVFRAEDSVTKQWVQQHGYGGLWCENAVQATARDIMADALVRMEQSGLQPVLTVHDEGICRIEAASPDEAKRQVEAIMNSKPAWCGSLPVAADASAAVRYMK